MAEFNAPTSKAEFEENFAQIKPLMTNNQAYYESSRCLFCYDAPCVKACPTAIDIPLFIKQIHNTNTLGAAKTIYDSNVFGYACGKVCPTEVLCEGSCVYVHQGVKPIEIGRLQSFAVSKAMKDKVKLYNPAPKANLKVAVIGAGPAGLACACELRLHGADVVVYEAKSQPSGLTVHGVAPYKITNEETLEEMDYLQEQFGFEVRYNQLIASKAQLDELENGFDYVFLGIGLGLTSKLNIPGEDKSWVLGAVEWIEVLRNKQHNTPISGKVIVLGGGNTAMDAASETARMGAENVILAYRRSKDDMPAYEFEYDLAKGVGVKGLFNAAPIEIFENGDGKGVRFIKTKVEQGSVLELPGTEFEVTCDLVIKATGQEKQTNFLSLISGLELDKGKIKVTAETGETNNARYYAAGDAMSGGQEVVNAVADGKKAAKAILRKAGILKA